MATLQHSFRYNGSLTDSLFDKVQIKFTFPVFEYILPNREAQETQVKRNSISSLAVEIIQDFSNNNYKVKLPAESITGKNDLVKFFLLYTTQCMSRNNDDITGLTLSIDTLFAADPNMPLGQNTLDALYFIRKNIRLLTIASKDTHPAEASGKFLENNIVLINKQVYTNLLPKFKEVSHSAHDLILLDIVQEFISATNADPGIGFNFDDNTNNILIKIIRSEKIEDIENTAAFVKENLTNLFDFPLTVEEIKTVKVEGDFYINTTDGIILSQDELLFYDLSLEYATINNMAGPQTLHYNWAEGADELDNNTIPFSFKDSKPIILNSVEGMISVNVKGFDGSLLYTKQFKPGLATKKWTKS